MFLQYNLPVEGVRVLKVALIRRLTSDNSVASYYNATIAGKTEVSDVAWFYPTPKDKAAQIKDYVAFYKVCRRRFVLRNCGPCPDIAIRTRLQSSKCGYETLGQRL